MSHEIELQRQAQPTPLELIQEALRGAVTPEEKQAAAGLVKELITLQQSMVRFQWESEERQAKIDFDDALSRCQARVSRLAPNQGRKSKKADTNNSIFWLDYAGLDSSIRPIYIAEGFSISFSEVPGGKDNYVGMKATLSRGGVSREYFKQLTLAPAFEGMPKADAEASAASRVKRYLMLQIFNIAIGIDADEKKPYEAEQKMPEPEMLEWLDAIAQAPNEKEMGEMLRRAHNAANEYKCDVSRLEFDKAGIKAIESPQALQNFYMARAKKWEAANNPHAVSELGKAYDKRTAEIGGQN